MMTTGTTRILKFQYHFMTLILLMLLLFRSSPAYAEGIFISAPSRIDMVYDSTRDIVYITNGDSVLRYHLATGTFLTAFQLGGDLKGIDLSPDGNTLAIADDERTDTQVWIHLVNLNTGQNSQVFFSRAFGEGGTFSVAYAGDGTILISSTFEGSGWVPLRRYDPVSDTTTTLASVRGNTMLVSSADGNTIAFAENDISDGRWGIYDLPTETLTQRQGYDDGTGWFNYEIGVNRFGSQYAIPTYSGTYIYDATFQHVDTIGQYAGQQPVGVVYHPTSCSVYFAWAGTNQVRSHDTRTFSQIATYDFEYTFSHTGNQAFTQGRLRISRDGTLLMATVDGGVRAVRVDAELSCKVYLPLTIK